MARRVAFLIGNQTFQPESGFLPLQGPANDVAAVARLLRDPQRGNFEVHEFLDKTRHEVLPYLERALGSAAVGDLFLIYYSGHGKLARNGHLLLATADTHQSALRATSIPARDLRDLVEESDCDQVVLLLDCCYSGAVDDGLRGDPGSELRVVEDAHGFYIMTASTAMQAARETAPLPDGMVMGRFTAALVAGIESGAADQGRKGKILLSDLRRHLEEMVTGSTPQFFARRASGDPLISFSPATAAPLLDAEVLADLDAEQWQRRHSAVIVLSDVLHDGGSATRAAAKEALQRRLGQERDYIVRPAIISALGPENVSAPDMPRQAASPTETSAPPLGEVTAPDLVIQAASARAAPDAAAAVGERFPDDLAVQREAGRDGSRARSDVPAGMQAASARAAADAVAAIGERFPDDLTIQREAAGARRNEAYAWSQVPAGAQATLVRAAADAVA
jgi:hypothetical protein